MILFVCKLHMNVSTNEMKQFQLIGKAQVEPMKETNTDHLSVSGVKTELLQHRQEHLQ